ncbi:unnamed protein product [Trichogramma brassicae]|uniref:Uncharacterized protein n=1 Tax=Trichogramma brassicae TaxID=86971 RepID=A0A6H5I324_9HYME|nr:unnamed protein product [Trichogramma brassicae]
MSSSVFNPSLTTPRIQCLCALKSISELLNNVMNSASHSANSVFSSLFSNLDILSIQISKPSKPSNIPELFINKFKVIRISESSETSTHPIDMKIIFLVSGYSLNSKNFADTIRDTSSQNNFIILSCYVRSSRVTYYHGTMYS